MTAIAWTLVGLMAGSLGVLATALFSGLGRIDALGARLDGRMDSLGARLDARIDAQGTELRTELRGLRSDIGEIRQALASHISG
jgi:hypothetical protein